VTIHPLQPFASERRRVPYVTDWLERNVRVVPVCCKTDFGVSRKGAVVHRVESAAAMITAGRIRYAARWLCGVRSTDITLLADASAHGGQICARCTESFAGTFVYRCLAADGRLLYVGCTHSYAARMASHKTSKPWWPEVADVTRESFGSLTEARAAERLAIQSEGPVYNRQWVLA
jgi:hypothetical protein